MHCSYISLLELMLELRWYAEKNKVVNLEKCLNIEGIAGFFSSVQQILCCAHSHDEKVALWMVRVCSEMATLLGWLEYYSMILVCCRTDNLPYGIFSILNSCNRSLPFVLPFLFQDRMIWIVLWTGTFK